MDLINDYKKYLLEFFRPTNNTLKITINNQIKKFFSTTLKDNPLYFINNNHLVIKYKSKKQDKQISNNHQYYDFYKLKYDTCKYIPIMNYKYYLLCKDNYNYIYLYNKRGNSYSFFDKENKLKYLNYVGNDNFRFKNKLYYVGDEIIDVSLLTDKNYKNLNAIRNNIMDYEDFCFNRQNIGSYQSIDSYKDLIDKVKENEDKYPEKTYVVELNEYGKKERQSFGLQPITEDLLFIDKGNHKEINPVFYNVLRYFDLSEISFKNVKVSGVDFTNTNARLIIDEVYQNDISGCFDNYNKNKFVKKIKIELKNKTSIKQKDKEEIDEKNKVVKKKVVCSMYELYKKYLEEAFNIKNNTNNIIYKDSNKPGIIIVTKKDDMYSEYNLLTNENKYLLNNWVKKIYPFNDDYAMIEKEFFNKKTKRVEVKINYIDTKGNYISSTWFDKGSEFMNGKALVMFKIAFNEYYYELTKDGKTNSLEKRPDDLIEINGKFVVNDLPKIEDISDFQVHNVRIKPFEGNFALVTARNEKNDLVNNYVKKDGKMIFQKFYSGLELSDGIFKYGKKALVLDKNIQLKGYNSSNPDNTSLTYGISDKGYVVYDTKRDKYFITKYIPMINYDNYIICSNNDDIYSFDKNMNKYQLLFEDKEITHVGVNNLIIDNKLFYVDDRIVNISDMGVKKYSSLKANKDVLTFDEFKKKYSFKNISDRKSITADELFTNKHGYKEIKSELIPYLSEYDLSQISFDSAFIAGIDFTGTNAIINPQKVKDKNMEGCIFIGIKFFGANFNGVNICNAKFSDINMCNIKGAIMSDNTVLGNTKRR